MQRSSGDLGYSLIEVLVALAIVAVISTLIFRSLGTQAQQVERVQHATARAMEGVADHRLLTSVISMSIPAWPEATSEGLIGTPTTMSGLTTGHVFSDAGGLQTYELRLSEVDQDRVDLVLSTEEGKWTLARLPADAAFSYYGYDGVWRPTWPEPPPSAFDVVDMETQFRNGPLPAMIRLTSGSIEARGNWIVGLANSEPLPLRANDLIGGSESVF